MTQKKDNALLEEIQSVLLDDEDFNNQPYQFIYIWELMIDDAEIPAADSPPATEKGIY
jgi:hypothetical protein